MDEPTMFEVGALVMYERPGWGLQQGRVLRVDRLHIDGTLLCQDLSVSNGAREWWPAKACTTIERRKRKGTATQLELWRLPE